MAADERPADQYVAYTLYRLDPAWRRLPIEERNAHKEAFAEVIETGRNGWGSAPTASSASAPRPT